MLSFDGIKSSMEKLENDEEEGAIECTEKGRREIRYSYYLKKKMAFTFGLTRSSKGKSKRFGYVPRQMGITSPEYRKLYKCTWYKKDLNKRLIELGIV